jgi:hypothetical protein
LHHGVRRVRGWRQPARLPGSNQMISAMSCATSET